MPAIGEIALVATWLPNDWIDVTCRSGKLRIRADLALSSRPRAQHQAAA